MREMFVLSNKREKVEITAAAQAMSEVFKNYKSRAPIKSTFDKQSLERMVAFCEKYSSNPPDKIDNFNNLQESRGWTGEFCEDLTIQELINLANVGDRFKIIPLKQLTCATIACLLKNKTENELAELFPKRF